MSEKGTGEIYKAFYISDITDIIFLGRKLKILYFTIFTGCSAITISFVIKDKLSPQNNKIINSGKKDTGWNGEFLSMLQNFYHICTTLPSITLVSLDSVCF